MSEQMLSSATGGLLSLNLSVTPQGAPAGALGVAPLFSGFSSMLNQQSEPSSSVTGFNSGVVLPSAGAALPQEFVSGDLSPETEQEYMRQQMMQVALMLEQQRASGAELPPELSAELARALKEYADQQPVMPQAPATTEPVSSEGASLTTHSLPPEVDSLLVDGGESISEISVEPSAVPSSSASVDAQLDEELIDARRADLNADQRVSLDQALPVTETVTAEAKVVAQGSQASIVPDNVQLKPVAGETQNRTTVVDDQSRSDFTAKAQAQAQTQDEIVRGNSVTMPGVLVSPERSRDAIAAEASVAHSLPGALDKAADRSAALSAANVKGELVPERSVSQQAQQPVTVAPELEQSAVKPQAKLGEQSQPQVQAVKVDSQPSLINKPEAQGALKFESALDMTQQLLQKVSAGEKVDNSASQLVEKVTGGSSLLTGASQSLAQPTAAQKTVAESQNLMMPQQVKINTPAWNNALGERAVMIAAQNTRVAEIRLDPPELGSLHVRVNVSQDQVSLSFTSPHAHVRDAVEQSLPRLREMFAEQGLALQDSSVSDQSSEQQQREQFAEGSGSDGRYGGVGGAESEADSPKEAMRTVSLVDYYA